MAEGNPRTAPQYLVANELRQSWNPTGWQRELTMPERVQIIMDMYVESLWIFCCSACFLLLPCLLPGKRALRPWGQMPLQVATAEPVRHATPE